MRTFNKPAAEGYGPYRGTFTTAEAAWDHLNQVRWQPEDQTIYVEQAKRQNHVQHIFNALVDLKHSMDGREARLYESFAKRQYPQKMLEAQCWALYNVIENLHVKGSTLLPHLDLSLEGSQDRKLNLAQRVGAVCLTLQHWKCVAADVANGYKLQELANAPLRYGLKALKEFNESKGITLDGTPLPGWEKVPEEEAARAAGPLSAPANYRPPAALPALAQNAPYVPPTLSEIPEGSFLVVRHDIYSSHQEVTHEGIYSPSNDAPHIPSGRFNVMPPWDPSMSAAHITTTRAPKDSLGEAHDSAPVAADELKPVPRRGCSSSQPPSNHPGVSDVVVDSHDVHDGASSAQFTQSKKRRRTSP